MQTHISDCLAIVWSSLVNVFLVCYSEKNVWNLAPITIILFENRKRKVFKISEHLPY